MRIPLPSTQEVEVTMPLAGARSERSHDAAAALALNRWWPSAVGNLRRVLDLHRFEAENKADGFGNFYEGRRAAMVFDVVASSQRSYEGRVLPMVRRYESTAPTIDSLALDGPGQGHGLRAREPATMRGVAAGLQRFALDHGLETETAVRTWAIDVEKLSSAPVLDPYVGAVSGIGPALFAYLRMRCGADALKPDGRVHAAMVHLGFEIPRDSHAILLVADAAAAELETTKLVLDQLLWWSSEVG